VSRGVLVVLAGTSGAGKGTLGRRLRDHDPDLRWSVSWTSRSPRPGEVPGVDYHFKTREEFEALRDAGGFLEWFDVYGDLKGTPREPVEEHLRAGDDVLLEVDIQGALAVRAQYPDALLVFVMPPSRDEQRRRVLGRAVEVPEDVEQRLAAGEVEEAYAGQFDAVVVNDDVGAAVDQVADILNARRSGH
jgi:guanylate kinase